MKNGQANILLVDDRPENLLALEAILESLGQNLVTATSGEEALKRLLTDDFAAILLDVQMPGMDGFETAELIKQRERTRHIPIVFLTAISKDSEHVFRGYSAGAVDYIFKPFDPNVLRSKVAVFVELYEKNEQLRQQAELLRERELAELARASEERYRNLAEAMPQMVWTARRDGSFNYVNGRWVDYTGITLEQAESWGWEPAVHPEDFEQMLPRWRDAVAAQRRYETECRFRRASDGSYRWHIVRALPILDGGGEVGTWVGTCTDIDDQKRTEQAQRVLVEAGAVLGSSLDYRSTLASVAEIVVPRIADWCAIDVLEEDGELTQLALAHVDPDKVAFVQELRRRYPPDPTAERGPANVVRTGRAELTSEISDELLQQAAVDELHLAFLRELALSSYMCVPLVVRGRPLGAITLASAEAGVRYDPDDLALAEELARRAAMAVDNTILYREAEERAQAARVLATVGDGVFLLDRNGVVRLWNPAAEAITGLAAARVLGRTAADVIPGWEERIAGSIPVASAPGPTRTRPETVPVEIGGRELWLSLSGVGFDEGTVYAFRDLTEERAVEVIKSEFVATVSHELRTPLAAVYGAAITLGRSDLALNDEMRAQLLQVISDESERLAEIVDDVLLASQMDSGSLQVRIESCDARELVRGVADAARVHLPENVSIELTAPAKLPRVAADPGPLRQVLVNLVDNAVKYSPDGGPVKIELERIAGHVRFSVCDHGLGIPVREQGRVFEKFYRLDPNLTRGVGGTGLGLYICRELVRRMNGRIWVESNDGKGSTFYVDLPVASARRGGARPKPRAGASRS